ncbi:hypothetical protein CHU94_08130 [Rhodoferax sp. TH121]|nr:hypothetical protein CHU94_08130 [Rhodoferax sp. TH121]
MQIEVKAPADVERCLYLFSIFQLRNKKRVRAYQLEVAPRSKRTHNGLTTIYGPHEHHWEDEPLPVTAEEVKCDNWSGALSWFFLRTSITPFEIKDPNHVEL